MRKFRYFFLIFLAHYAYCLTVIDNCMLLDTANEYYILNASVTANTTTCFSITANNITLDCYNSSKNNDIIGQNITTTYGIYSNQYNTTIRNCNISNFQHGIYFNGADNGSITNTATNTTHSTGYGIYISNSANFNTITNSSGASAIYAGIYVGSSNDFLIEKSYGKGVTYGIVFASNSRAVMTNCTGETTTGSGVALSDTTGGVYENFTAFSTAGGYGARPGGSHARINNMTATSSSHPAAHIISGNNITITNSTFIAAGTSGVATTVCALRNQEGNNFTVANSIMIGKGFCKYYQWAHGWNFTNNTIYANFSYGMGIEKLQNSSFTDNMVVSNFSNPLYITNSTGNIFRNNTFVSTVETAALAIIDSTAGNNTFYWNNFTNTSGSYVSDSNGSNNFNYSSGGTNIGNIWYNVINGSVNIYGLSSTIVSWLLTGIYGTGYPYNDSNSYDKVVNVIDFAPLTTLILNCSGSVTFAATQTIDGAYIEHDFIADIFSSNILTPLCFENYTCFLLFQDNTTYKSTSSYIYPTVLINNTNLLFYRDINGYKLPYKNYCGIFMKNNANSTTEVREYYVNPKIEAVNIEKNTDNVILLGLYGLLFGSVFVGTSKMVGWFM